MMPIRIYRALLRLFPLPFRRAFGPDMAEVFVARCRAERRRGWLAPWAALAREVPDVVRAAWGERFPHRGRRHRRRNPVSINVLGRETRLAVRSLARAPGFAGIVLLTMALGIGANTAIFSVVNAVLLVPPPFPDPGELVMVWESNLPRSVTRNVVNPQNYTAWTERNEVFEAMGAMFSSPRNLVGDHVPRQIQIGFVTAGLFNVLGASPVRGRTFTVEEMEPGRHRVAVLSHGFWQRHFGGDDRALGQTLTIQDHPYQIVGVMGPEFVFPENTEVWLPLALGGGWRASEGRSLTAIGRLLDGVTLAAARRDMDRVAAGLVAERPDFNTGWGVSLVPLHEQIAGDVRPALLVLLAAVAFVLIIACANVANLLLGRGVTRSKEVAIRVALGAGRGRIATQMLTESMVLATAAAVLGVGVAYGAMQALVALAPADLPRVDTVAMDGRVLAFTVVVAIATGLLFGLVPALHAMRTDPHGALKEGGRSATPSAGRRMRAALVLVEVAAALVLLVGAGLLIRSFDRLLDVDLGFVPEGVLSASVQLPPSRYASDAQRAEFFTRAVERIGSIPGVRSAGAINYLPLGGPGAATTILLNDRPRPPEGEDPVAGVRAVHWDYFRTMRIPFVRGRGFDGREAPRTERYSIVINQTMADRYWPDRNPVGRTVTMEWNGDRLGEVIGVVGDVRHEGLESVPRPMTYWAHAQFPFPFMSFTVRVDGDPASHTEAVQEAIWSIDPNLPVADVRPMTDRLGESFAQRRFNMLLLGIFAAAAVVLSCVGIYGVMAYSIAQRRHELGLRMALGARPTAVVGMVVRQGMTLVGLAMALGFGVAAMTARAMSNLLFGIGAFDPLTFVGVAMLLSVAGGAACMIPALRATRVDPVQTLRDG